MLDKISFHKVSSCCNTKTVNILRSVNNRVKLYLSNMRLYGGGLLTVVHIVSAINLLSDNRSSLSVSLQRYLKKFKNSCCEIVSLVGSLHSIGSYLITGPRKGIIFCTIAFTWNQTRN